jgi:hypothetical protein
LSVAQQSRNTHRRFDSGAGAATLSANGDLNKSPEASR